MAMACGEILAGIQSWDFCASRRADRTSMAYFVQSVILKRLGALTMHVQEVMTAAVACCTREMWRERLLSLCVRPTQEQFQSGERSQSGERRRSKSRWNRHRS